MTVLPAPVRTDPTAPVAAGPAPAAVGTYRLHRRPDGRLVGGVAAGLAEHLGVEVLWVRLAFAVLSGINGFGVLVYAGLWVFAPISRPDDEAAGLAAAARAGRRPRSSRSRGDLGQLVALGAIALGLVLLLSRTRLGVPTRILVPALIASAGLALIWSQTDSTDRERVASASWLAALGTGRSRWLTIARLAGGIALVVTGVIVFTLGGSPASELGETLLVLLVVMVGAMLVVGPLLWRLVRQVEAERRELVLTQQQADVAAHLHDSVLQTLALIQRKADDPRAVVALARAQERDLRGWLYGVDQTHATTLGAALEQAAAAVEQTHGVPVEVVVVGDAALDDDLSALVRAATEAMVNAARHSGAPVVDVFAECTGSAVEVFVRDRGKGFALETVPADRMGLRGPVVGRVERHGRTAVVRSAPGEGTEVRLAMSVDQAQAAS